MQYFTSDMWRELNAADSKIRNLADEKWDKAWDRYREYMERIRPKLSKRKWQAIMRCHRFHDDVIHSIEIHNRWYGKKCLVDVTLNLDEKAVVFKNVTDFSFRVNNQEALPMGNYSWGYCEFELLNKDKLRAGILCDVTNEINIEFQNLECRKLTE